MRVAVQLWEQVEDYSQLLAVEEVQGMALAR